MPELPKDGVRVSDFGKRADENRRRRAFFTNNASVRGIFWYFHHLQSRRHPAPECASVSPPA